MYVDYYRISYKINSDYANMFNALHTIGSVIGFGLYRLSEYRYYDATCFIYVFFNNNKEIRFKGE